MDAVIDELAAATRFSGVVRVDRDGEVLLARAYGMASRAAAVPNTVATRFGLASGTKPFTAMTVLSLVGDGVLSLDTTARSLLGTDLPLVDDAVTVEHLLAHRSGIGDYYDEDAGGDVNDYVLTIPVHELATTEAYVRVLDGYPQKFTPGASFSYCNAGYVVLALLAERAAGVPFQQLVADRVCAPAGMADTAFLRSDELPAGVAVGYLEADGLRTNVFHLPVLGSGDGGICSTVGDVHALWRAVLAGDVLPLHTVAAMHHPHSPQYGWGWWLRPADGAVFVEGCDAGVSFRSVRLPSGVLHTTVSNTSDGAWPMTKQLDALLQP